MNVFKMKNNHKNRMYLKSHFDLISSTEWKWVNDDLLVGRGIMMSYKQALELYLFQSWGNYTG